MEVTSKMKICALTAAALYFRISNVFEVVVISIRAPGCRGVIEECIIYSVSPR